MCEFFLIKSQHISCDNFAAMMHSKIECKNIPLHIIFFTGGFYTIISDQYWILNRYRIVIIPQLTIEKAEKHAQSLGVLHHPT